MRIIDADELLAHIYKDKIKVSTKELIIEMIKNMPTTYEGNLTWLHPKHIPLSSMQNDLFLCYRAG